MFFWSFYAHIVPKVILWACNSLKFRFPILRQNLGLETMSPDFYVVTALPAPGLPSLTLTSSALHDGAHSHSLTVVSARGVAGGCKVMQRDRVLAPAAYLFSTPALWRARALDLCATGGVRGASGPHSGT